MNNLIRSSLSIFSQTFKQPTTISQQVRNKWTDYRMKKDARRRKTVEDYGAVKMRLNIIRKNRVIPMELQVKHENR
ncbi:28S ribosomal protein S14, mitochondrial [Diaphorina citri]|uniref:28S ribosomal protein S14, mitochondrial n=1 Tax=Diaphorina citri TaxID=121845 RepID=A0A3Q0J2L0_DIACI|nr:28S ribosomal protein S14, mitochondrial [Diaphorina citri]